MVYCKLFATLDFCLQTVTTRALLLPLIIRARALFPEVFLDSALLVVYKILVRCGFCERYGILHMLLIFAYCRKYIYKKSKQQEITLIDTLACAVLSGVFISSLFSTCPAFVSRPCAKKEPTINVNLDNACKATTRRECTKNEIKAEQNRIPLPLAGITSVSARKKSKSAEVCGKYSNGTMALQFGLRIGTEYERCFTRIALWHGGSGRIDDAEFQRRSPALRQEKRDAVKERIVEARIGSLGRLPLAA